MNIWFRRKNSMIVKLEDLLVVLNIGFFKKINREGRIRLRQFLLAIDTFLQ